MSSTYREAYTAACEALTASGVPDAAYDAKRLMEYACGVTFSDLYAHGERELSKEKQQLLNKAIKKRSSRIPLAYITGTQGFMGLDFTVAPGVLVPRQDTETLAEEARRHLFDGMRVLDLCTGSGCVALSLLYYSNDTEAVATDRAQEALGCAEANAKRLGLAARVRFVRCDLFPGTELIPEGGFDLLTANPPYIRTDVIETLEDEVRLHEPRMALDGGTDGLAFYRRIAKEAGAWLSRGGRILLETGFDQASAVTALLAESGFCHLETVRDAGGNERVVTGVRIPR